MFIATDAPQDELILKLLPVLVEANAILNEEFQHYCAGEHFDIHTKSDQSPVTQADYRVNEYITTQLNALFPYLPILSEEGQHNVRKQWSKFWLLDPLDGTKEFIQQRPQFTLNLSLIDTHQTIFSVLTIPAEHLIYICPLQGLPLKYDTQQKCWWIYAAQHSNKLVVGVSHSAQKKQAYTDYLAALQQLIEFDVYKAGSAYKFCMMLEDQVDLYPRFHPTCEWDTSAGQCLLERVGGGLVDFSNRSFIYNARDELLNGGFIAYKNENIRELAFQALALDQSAD